MKSPPYRHLEIESRWRDQWNENASKKKEGIEAPSIVSNAPLGDDSPAGNSPKNDSSSDFSSTSTVHPERVHPERVHPEKGKSGESEKSRKGIKPRGGYKTHYVYPTPLSPVLDDQIFTEIRRLVTSDIYARLQKLMGAEVFFPLGISYWGEGLLEKSLQSELHPSDYLKSHWEPFKNLLTHLGLSLDSVGEVNDQEPEYYRWTQWIFLQLMRRKILCNVNSDLSQDEPVEELQDSLSFSEFENTIISLHSGQGKEDEKNEKETAQSASDRGMGQWLIQVSSYGDRLLSDLGKSNWPIEDRNSQRHLIGRLRGCNIVFQVSNQFRLDCKELEIFTTRVETLYGATFILVHPWHPVVNFVTQAGYEGEIYYYRKRVLQNIEPRLSGVRTGGYAINPINLEKIPILVSRLAMEPEKGPAIMGVPAHDPLLFEIARRVSLPIREVLRGNDSKYDAGGKLAEAFTSEGVLWLNNSQLTGWGKFYII